MRWHCSMYRIKFWTILFNSSCSSHCSRASSGRESSFGGKNQAACPLYLALPPAWLGILMPVFPQCLPLLALAFPPHLCPPMPLCPLSTLPGTVPHLLSSGPSSDYAPAQAQSTWLYQLLLSQAAAAAAALAPTPPTLMYGWARAGTSMSSVPWAGAGTEGKQRL